MRYINGLDQDKDDYDRSKYNFKEISFYKDEFSNFLAICLEHKESKRIYARFEYHESGKIKWSRNEDINISIKKKGRLLFLTKWIKSLSKLQDVMYYSPTLFKSFSNAEDIMNTVFSELIVLNYHYMQKCFAKLGNRKEFESYFDYMFNLHRVSEALLRGDIFWQVISLFIHIVNPPKEFFLQANSAYNYGENYICLLSESVMADLPYFSEFFKSSDIKVLSSLAKNKRILEFPEAYRLFSIENEEVLLNLAMNPSAKKFDQYSSLFEIAIKRSYDKLIRYLGSNPESCKFKEFALFLKTNGLPMIFATTNPNAVDFEEYERVYEEFPALVSLNSAAQKNKERWTSLYFYSDGMRGDKYRETLEIIKGSGDFDAYKTLFKYRGGSKELSINAIQFNEMNDFLLDNPDKMKDFIRENPYFIYFSAIHKYLDSVDKYDSLLYELVSSENSTYFLNFSNLFGIDQFTDRAIASNEGATKFREYKEFFNSKYELANNHVADNPNAVYLDEYPKLFDDTEMHRYISGNVNAVKFSRFKEFYKNKDLYCNLARNPRCMNEDFAKGLKRYSFDDYNRNEIFHGIAKNPEGYKMKIFKDLFDIKDKDGKFVYAIDLLRNKNAAEFYPKEFRNLIEVSIKGDYYDAEKAMEAITHNPNIAIYGKFLDAQMRLWRGDVFKRIYAASPYLANTRYFHKMILRSTDDETKAKFASNKNAVFSPEFQKLFKMILEPSKQKEESYGRDFNIYTGLPMHLAENENIPIYYPEIYHKLLCHMNYCTRKYAFQNPSGFNFIRSLILKNSKGSKIMNEDKKPIFRVHTYFSLTDPLKN